MNGRLMRALLAGGLAVLAGLVVDALLNQRYVLLLFLALLAVLAVFAPHVDRAFDGAITASLRAWRWRKEEGHHHAFDGLSLRIEEDARANCWVDGADLQRLVGTRDPEDVLAARFSNRWRHDAKGRLMLRVDAVVDHLARAPGRMDPRTIKLRRYFEREVLFPAANRRAAQVAQKPPPPPSRSS